MTEPLRILPPGDDEPTAWMEATAERQAEVRAEREAWTGRPVTKGFSMAGEALQSLAAHGWKLPRRKRRSRAEKEAYADMLRANMTQAESALWRWLQGFDLDFSPQVLVAGWVVDFYSAELALVIEVDGSVHQKHRLEQDRERTRSLEAAGNRVVRITNSEVMAGTYYSILEEIG